MEKFKILKEKIYSEGQKEATPHTSKKKALNIIRNKVLVSGIELNGVEKQIEKWMRRACTIKVGDHVCKEDIDKSVSIYYGTGNYESITYTLHKDETSPEGYIVRFKFVEKSPHDFGLGFRFDSQDMLSVLLHLGINSNRISGFKTSLDSKLGGNQWLKLNFSYGHMLYPKINLGYNFRNSELDVYDMDKLNMNNKFLQHKFRLYLSENYSRTFSIHAGFEVEFMDPRKVMYSLHDAVDMDYESVNTIGTFASLNFDNLNKNRFATRGVKGNFDFTWKDCTFNKKGLEKLHFGSMVFGFESYIPVIEERFVIIPQLYGSFLFGKGSVNGINRAWNPTFRGPVPMYPYMNNLIGGTETGRYIDHQLPFIGVNKVSFAFNNLAIARIDFRTRLFKNHYLTAMFNYGRSSIDLNNFLKDNPTLQWSELYKYNASNWWGAGLRYSIDTKIGPLSLDVSSSNISRKANIYFSYGYFF